MLGCILFLIIHDLLHAIQSQKHLSNWRQPQHYEDMLFTAHGFPAGKGVIGHYSILAPEAAGVSQA